MAKWFFTFCRTRQSAHYSSIYSGKKLSCILQCFYDVQTRINVDVSVRFINEEQSPGLKKGGVLNVVRHAVEVYAPATAIPEVFEIDVTGLDVGDGIHASSINLPAGVTFMITDRDFTIATIAAPSALRSSDDDADASAESEEGEEKKEEEAPQPKADEPGAQKK